MSRKRKSFAIADEISNLLTPKTIADPEDDDDITAAKMFQYDSFDEDEPLSKPNNQLSAIRKKNIQTLDQLDKKYQGNVVSRKSMVADNSSNSSNDEENESDIDSEDENSIEYSENDIDEINNDEHDVDSEDSDAYESEDTEEEEADVLSINNKEHTNESNLQHFNKIDATENVKKGLAVQNQLKLWEKLLEIRIQFQKTLIKSNSLPAPEKLETLKNENTEISNLLVTIQNQTQTILDNLMKIQQHQLNKYTETTDLEYTICEKEKFNNKRSGDKILEITPKHPRIDKYEQLLEHNFSTYIPYRNKTLSKWHDKTKIFSASAKEMKQANNLDIVKKIESSLINKNDLIRKSQLLKRDAETDEELYSAEIYNDSDFYHQLLRELIEFKTNNTTNPSEITKQYAELQKLRNKMKKRVDTRASKGRKIRYVVHNKMVNFMAPNPESEWTDESRAELFTSLFGSMKYQKT